MRKPSERACRFSASASVTRRSPLATAATIERAPTPRHGKSSRISHEGTGLFDGLPQPFEAGRYHSLVVREETLPAELGVVARSEDGLVMALAHRALPVFGVQFHPESVLTPEGERILANFLRLAS